MMTFMMVLMMMFMRATLLVVMMMFVCHNYTLFVVFWVQSYDRSFATQLQSVIQQLRGTS